MNTVKMAMLEGIILVTVIIFLLLGTVRGAVVVSISLPLSVLITFIAMKWIGLEANLMSLGGLVISLGMIVDATIIQVENIHRHLGGVSDRKHRLSTILKAASEVLKPSMFGELIIILTFVPIITLEGMAGKMFCAFALTVALALLASLFISLFIAPAMCELFLRSGKEKHSRLLILTKKLYLPALEWSLKERPLEPNEEVDQLVNRELAEKPPTNMTYREWLAGIIMAVTMQKKTFITIPKLGEIAAEAADAMIAQLNKVEEE